MPDHPRTSLRWLLQCPWCLETYNFSGTGKTAADPDPVLFVCHQCERRVRFSHIRKRITLRPELAQVLTELAAALGIAAKG